MKEHPILFNADMVRAVLAGKKTQTRRTLKDGPVFGPDHYFQIKEGESAWPLGAGRYAISGTAAPPQFMARCPFGAAGHRLWVRETYGTVQGAGIHTGYRADGEPAITGMRWTPSIHMPRRHSRIILEVTRVCVERLQDITEEGARAEGVESREAFSELWNAINGPNAWGYNPWVWAVTFKPTRLP